MLSIILGPVSLSSDLVAEAPGGAYLTIAGKFGGEITTDDIIKHTTLGIDGCAAGSEIYQFTLVVKANGKSSSYAGKSDVLTDEMLTALRRLDKGDEFTFKRVKAKHGKNDDIDVMARTFVII